MKQIVALATLSLLFATPALAQEDDQICVTALQQSDMGEYDAAAAGLENCLASVELTPEQEVMIYAELGSVRMAMEDYAGALQAFAFTFAIAETQGAQISHPMIYRNRGISLGQTGELERALGDLLQAYSMLGDDPLTLVNLGWTYGQLERHEDAVVIYDRLVRTEPEWSGAWLNRSAAFLDLGMISEAVSDARRAVEIDPEDGSSLNMLCWTLIQDGRAETALPLCRQAAELEPESGHVIHSLATALEATGSQRRARRLFAQAFELEPEDPEIIADYERTHRP